MSVINAVIYTRVSTTEQALDGYSVKAQRDTLRDYARRNHLTIIDEYVDEGKSGKSIEGRPEMTRLLKDAAQKKFDTIIIYKLDRLARKTRDSLEIAETLNEHGVQLISLSESIDTSTPHGRMFYTVLSSLAEMERDQIVGRVKMGMTQRAKEGKWNGGQCLGYDSKDKKLYVNPNEAKIVREIFELADKGYGYKKIAGIINRKGYKTKKDKEFSIGTLKGILDNPMYIGKVRFNQHENWSEQRRKGKNKEPIIVDGQHEPIIDKELWERVQFKRKGRSYKAVQSSKPYFLSKLIRCPQCGSGMVAAKSKGKTKTYRYYVCGNFHNKGTTVCSSNSINADVAEAQVLAEFKRIVTDSNFVKELVKKMNEEREQAIEPLIEQKKYIESRIKQKDVYITNITEKLMKDPDLVSSFSEILKEQQNEKITNQKKLEEIEEELANINTKPIDLMAFHHFIKNMDEILHNMNGEEKKELLRMIVEQIEITPSAEKRSHSRQKGREVTSIKLYFDFTPEAVKKKSKSLIIKMANFAPSKNVDFTPLNKVNPTEKELRDTLRSLSVLPSLMVRFPSINPKPAIHLLQ
ncbi:recombinase family protein [Virgibacillus salexigens]|uniref:recombinase family protein n=1 Tax=Virgibacillus salexigens TaxID=61016 RepID=UPI001909DF13|nr:recombinase family protein [Virgibacillus salexigens]